MSSESHQYYSSLLRDERETQQCISLCLDFECNDITLNQTIFLCTKGKTDALLTLKELTTHILNIYKNFDKLGKM